MEASEVHRAMLRELLDSRNLLCVVGRGLGLETLLALLCRVYAGGQEREGPACEDGPIVVLGSAELAERIVSRAKREDWPSPGPVCVGGETGAERARVYGRGRGVVFVPNAQLLVVDVLRGSVPRCGGVVVANAHAVEEYGTVWFALRLLRDSVSPACFIKGLSGRPELLQSAGRCEGVMRSLLASRLLLWPRFEARVSAALNSSPPDVVELLVPPSALVIEAREALQILVGAVLDDLARANPGLELPPPPRPPGLELASHIRAQLGASASKLTRRRIGDLSVLRKLYFALLSYDSVMFNRYLEAVRLEGGGEGGVGWGAADPSEWLFHAAADRLFRAARARVVTGGDGTSTAPPVLAPEPLGKWGALREALAEVREQQGPGASAPVLIVTKDERTARQVAGVLAQGDEAWLLAQFNESIGRGMYRHRPQQQQQQQQAQQQGPQKKSRKKKAPARKTSTSVADLFRRQVGPAASAAPPPPPSAAAAARRDALDRQFGRVDGRGVVVVSLDGGWGGAEGEDLGGLLFRLRPTFIVMYDADLAFLRMVEVYLSTFPLPAPPLRLYLLAYDLPDAPDAAELESENRAFENLISLKASLIIEEERGQVMRGVVAAQQTASSRRGGDGGKGGKRPYIIADTREFAGSHIPAKMWMCGYDVIPVMLEVGDYVVSDDICVERKTLSDLVSSFIDGRLLRQCQQMEAHYRVPVLLIEFEGGPFALQTAADLTQEVAPQALSSKLALLVLQCPRLRLLWARNVAHAASLLTQLRGAAPSPDLARATESAARAGRAADGETIVDRTPAMLLSKLPGVVPGNSEAVARRAGSLRSLLRPPFDVTAWEGVMGRDNARALAKFLASRYRDEQVDKKPD